MIPFTSKRFSSQILADVEVIDVKVSLVVFQILLNEQLEAFRFKDCNYLVNCHLGMTIEVIHPTTLLHDFLVLNEQL
jgi:hypothetical protein